MRDVPNVHVDLSGSGVDGGMLELVSTGRGERMLWGADITMDTGWAKLRYLEYLSRWLDMDQVRGGTPRGFPARSFHGCRMIDVNIFLGGLPFRRVPGTITDAILAAMDRLGIGTPGCRTSPPSSGNPPKAMPGSTRPPSTCRGSAVPPVEPELAHWESELADAV